MKIEVTSRDGCTNRFKWGILLPWYDLSQGIISSYLDNTLKLQFLTANRGTDKQRICVFHPILKSKNPIIFKTLRTRYAEYFPYTQFNPSSQSIWFVFILNWVWFGWKCQEMTCFHSRPICNQSKSLLENWSVIDWLSNYHMWIQFESHVHAAPAEPDLPWQKSNFPSSPTGVFLNF